MPVSNINPQQPSASNMELLEQRCEKAEREVQRLAVENALLRETIRLLNLKKFGSKSDKLSDRQMELLALEPSLTVQEIEAEAQLPEGEKTEEKLKQPRKIKHPGRTEMPPNLRRVVKRIECTPEQCLCLQCGAEKKVIGYDSSEQIDLIPAEYIVRVTEREKRACAKCEEMGVSMAPLPERIIEKAKASDALVIDIVIKKACDHLPLFRQCVAMKRDAGVDLSRTTLCGWFAKVCFLLMALVRAMREELLSGSYIQADETTVSVQNDKPNGKNHTGYMWQYSRPGGPVIFDFQMTRSREGPANFLRDFGGRLQCDAYSVYDKIGKVGIMFFGCFAHARREFTEAAKLDPLNQLLLGVIAQIGKLYAVEAKAREQKLCNAARLALRQKESVPLLTELKAQVIALRTDSVLPGSKVSRACDYTLSQWDRLIGFASYGDVEIDNNICENAMRPIALGRKNWLHIGAEHYGAGTAALYSVIETCRRLGINPREYMLDVLPKLGNWPANRVGELTPSKWLAQRWAD